MRTHKKVINRHDELAVIRMLSRLRAGPRMYGCFDNGRIEEFLSNARPLTPALMLVVRFLRFRFRVMLCSL
jgi:hypothetical protein